jgi:hypothetical protein
MSIPANPPGFAGTPRYRSEPLIQCVSHRQRGEVLQRFSRQKHYQDAQPPSVTSLRPKTASAIANPSTNRRVTR